MSAITTGDGGPMKVWERTLEGDTDVIMEIACEKVAEGWSLRRIAHANRWPARLFIAWIEADEERTSLYRSALKVAAEFHVDQVEKVSDEATMEDWQLRKFQAETHKWIASKYDRQRFGDDKTANVGVAVGNITIVHESS